jgi:hypothetical protein
VLLIRVNVIRDVKVMIIVKKDTTVKSPWETVRVQESALKCERDVLTYGILSAAVMGRPMAMPVKLVRLE